MSAAPWPKRRETTFTSSGWETKSAIVLLRCFLLVLVQNPVHLLCRQILVEGIVHLHCWRPTASADAFHFFERKHSVLSGSFVSNPQPALAMLQKLFAAAQQASNVGADLHVVQAARFGGQHGVVADHVAHFELGNIHV